MMEGALSNFAGNVLTLLSSEALKQLGMVIGNENDLRKLKSIVSRVHALLWDAEKGPDTSNLQEDWLTKLGEVLYDADDVLDEISTQALWREVMTRGKNAKQVWIFFSKSNQLAFNYEMSQEIKKIMDRLDEICAENNLGLSGNYEARKQQHGLSHQTSNQLGTHSAHVGDVIGRDDEKMSIKRLLLDMGNVEDHNVSFIAIVGMSGIGKTALARLLYNDREVSTHFDLKMWVWVSHQFDVNRVVKEMIELASGRNPKVKGIEALYQRLKELIKEKKYLLVMDDVWNDSGSQWDNLIPLLMLGARGSKILITKEDRVLPTPVGKLTKFIELKGLNDSRSWSLFQKVVFKELGNTMIGLGKKILEKCSGIPLVIIHIGNLLYSKFSEEEWKSFQKDELLRITREKNAITIIFQLSYQHLPPHLKQCCAYSSFYSKKDYITKHELIKQWVAHGFVESLGESKSMEDIANDYFMELCSRPFFEDRGHTVVMHEIMRDVVRMVASIGGAGERIHHFSSFHDILPRELPETKRLRTLCMSGYRSINEVDLNKFVFNFPRLRVLDLSGGNIKTVPDSLTNLQHLRYLDLSENLDLQSLPNLIGKLVNLQTLYLNGCKALKILPEGINDLTNLRHLKLECLSALTHMPKGMGKLTCLQTLNFFVLDNSKDGSKLSELNELRNLSGDLYIKGLEELRGNPSEAKLANLKVKESLRDLVLQWKPGSKEDESEDGLNDESILEDLELHPNVESVCIWRYKGKGLPNWMSNPESKLTHISIVKCNRLQHLPQFDHLPALKKLQLEELTSLRFIDKNNPGSSTSVFFPSLEILILKKMQNLEGWWEGESRVVVGDEEVERRRNLLSNFACLTRLHIYDCPKLGWLPRQPFLTVVEFNKVGAQMVRSIGPSSNLGHVTLTNIEDLQDLPREVCSLTVQLQISNCPNLRLPADSISNYWKYANYLINPYYRNCLRLRPIENLLYLCRWNNNAIEDLNYRSCCVM